MFAVPRVIAMSTRRTCRLLRLPIAPHTSTLGLFTGFAGQKAISIVGLILYETCHGAVYELISTAFGQVQRGPQLCSKPAPRMPIPPPDARGTAPPALSRDVATHKGHSRQPPPHPPPHPDPPCVSVSFWGFW